MSKALPVPVEKLSKAALADEWGPLKARAKRDEQRLDELKAEFERRGLVAAEGLKFSITKSTSSFDGIDVQAARAELGEAWCKKHVKPVVRTTYTVHPVAKKKAAA